MRVISYGLSFIFAILLTLTVIFYGKTSHKALGVWVGAATLIVGVLAVAFYWHDSIRSNEKEVTLEEPTFSEEIETVSFSIGGGGMTAGYSFEALKKSPREPFNFGGHIPVKLYVEKGNIYADVKIHGESGIPPIEVKKNKILNKPDDWDLNSNENALEIVNAKQVPIYQFYYKTPSHIVMNGIFPFPGGLILANEDKAIINPTMPTAFKLKRIFKYPAWKYPGKYDE